MEFLNTCLWGTPPTAEDYNAVMSAVITLSPSEKLKLKKEDNAARKRQKIMQQQQDEDDN